MMERKRTKKESRTGEMLSDVYLCLVFLTDKRMCFKLTQRVVGALYAYLQCELKTRNDQYSGVSVKSSHRT